MSKLSFKGHHIFQILNVFLTFHFFIILACLYRFSSSSDGSVVRNPSAMQETQATQVQSLGQEDPLEEGMSTHSNILVWKNPMNRGACSWTEGQSTKCRKESNTTNWRSTHVCRLYCIRIEILKSLLIHLLSFNFIYLFIFITIIIFLFYNIVLVLPYINMNLPRVYTCSPSWTPSHLPPRTIPPGHPSAPASSILYPASNLQL